MKNIKILILLFTFTCISIIAKIQEGTIIQTNINAPSLGNNKFDDITDQSIIIYLPPLYNTSDMRYPVVYFLTGFSTPNTDFLNGSFQGYRLQNSMDNLIAQGKIKEMIVVIPNGLTFMLGSYYVNSSVRGNWEDYLVYDLINYIDNNYRTISEVNSRGIAGHSMGGFGALNLAMLHPDIFCATYGLSPGLFDKNGLKDQGMFSQSMINKFISKQEEWSVIDTHAAMTAFKDYISYLKSINDYDTIFSYAYGAALSPDPENHPPYIAYPYSRQGGQIVCDSTLLRNYENGFGGLSWKVEQYKENLLKLKGITIDYGKYDSYAWIRRGSVYFSQLLDDADIPHNLLSFNGGHSDMVRSRIEDHIMPFFSETLTFDGSINAVNKNEGMLNPSNFYFNNIPNPFNPSTTIKYHLPNADLITIIIYNIHGQQIEILIDDFQCAGNFEINWTPEGLPAGLYFCVLKAENHLETRKLVLQK